MIKNGSLGNMYIALLSGLGESGLSENIKKINQVYDSLYKLPSQELLNEASKIDQAYDYYLMNNRDKPELWGPFALLKILLYPDIYTRQGIYADIEKANIPSLNYKLGVLYCEKICIVDTVFTFPFSDPQDKGERLILAAALEGCQEAVQYIQRQIPGFSCFLDLLMTCPSDKLFALISAFPSERLQTWFDAVYHDLSKAILPSTYSKTSVLLTTIGLVCIDNEQPEKPSTNVREYLSKPQSSMIYSRHAPIVEYIIQRITEMGGKPCTKKISEALEQKPILSIIKKEKVEEFVQQFFTQAAGTPSPQLTDPRTSSVSPLQSRS